MTLPTQATIVEVGARDGLQNESRVLSVQTRAELINLLTAANLRVIEIGSFVSTARVPQMADSGAVFAAIAKRNDVRYSALTPNVRGLDDALAAGVREVAVFTAASESFCRANTNCTMAESLAHCAEVAERALARGAAVRGYVSCALGCPYEGAIDPRIVARIAAQLHAVGCYEISLGDTIGVGTPQRAVELIECVGAQVSVQQLAVHFHDTYGQALANIYAVLQLGVRVIDSAVAGLGGCPFARGASGNVATEDVVYLLNGLGIECGVDLDKLLAAANYACTQLGRRTHSRAGAALSTVHREQRHATA